MIIDVIKGYMAITFFHDNQTTIKKDGDACNNENIFNNCGYYNNYQRENSNDYKYGLW